VDLATIVGLDGEEVAKRPFTPPLLLIFGHKKKCTLEKRFPVLDSHDKQVKEIAIDFLRNMMKIDPRERKNCTQLLQHPFLKHEF